MNARNNNLGNPVDNVQHVIDKEQQTIEYYNNNAQAWAAGRVQNSGEKSYWHEQLIVFGKYLSSGSVLEIGCGTGTDGNELIKMGYQYTGVDVSSGLLNLARKRFPAAKFLLQSIYDLNFPNASFDGFWCAATLLHIPKEKIDVALQNIKRVVKSKGIGFISIKEGNGQFLDKPTNRWFFLYIADEFSAILRKNGFSIERQASIKNQSNTGLTTWLTFFVRS